MTSFYNLSPVQLGAWAVMAVLVVKAIAHWLEARSLARRLRPIERRFEQLSRYMAGGGSPERVMSEARRVAEDTPLATMFEPTIRLRDAAGIRDQVEEAVQTLLGPLYAAAAHNELAGPRFGLAMTALGVLVRFSGASIGGSATSELAGVGLALVSTAMGITAAIIEAHAISHYLAPLESRLSVLGMGILLRASAPEDWRERRPEVIHVA